MNNTLFENIFQDLVIAQQLKINKHWVIRIHNVT